MTIVVNQEENIMATKTVQKTEAQVEKKKGWRIKEYYVDPKAYSAAKAELAKAPNQVQIMVNHFAEEFNTPDKAAQGRVMCESAIAKAGLKTVIQPNVLFAYYRKTMEAFGLRLKS